MNTTAFDELWALTSGDPEATTRLHESGPEHLLPSPFAVTEAAAQSVGASALAAAEFHAARGGGTQEVRLEREHAAAAFSATQLLRLLDERIEMWAPISGTYEARDGRYVQLHCNFPHHESGVTSHLGVPAEREAVADAVRQRDAFELESELVEQELIAVACRTIDEWSQHPHAEATDGLPVLELLRSGEAPPAERPAAARPLEGVRVLDCSRVLAGPVGGQTLASHGAEVLRIGAEHLPTVPGGIRSTGFGKRNADLDLRTADDRATFARLVTEADVVIDAYRPEALAQYGFSAERLAELHPGLVVVQLCAFDWDGPWGGRRGYDSIVQSTTGIAMAGAGAGARLRDGVPRGLHGDPRAAPAAPRGGQLARSRLPAPHPQLAGRARRGRPGRGASDVRRVSPRGGLRLRTTACGAGAGRTGGDAAALGACTRIHGLE